MFMEDEEKYYELIHACLFDLNETHFDLFYEIYVNLRQKPF